MRYEKYKLTNVFWLPEIPVGWDWLLLSQTAKEQCRKKPKGATFNVMSLSYGNVIRKKNIDAGLVPDNYDNYQVIQPGNIILRLTDLQNDHTSLRTGLVKETGIITSAYTCLAPEKNSAFLQYLLHSYDTRKVFYGMGGGVRQSIGYKDIRSVRVPIPPREEQDQIVRYLDWKVSKINKLIAAKKKQIALLEELKQKRVDIIFQRIEENLENPIAPIGRHITSIESGTSVNSEYGSAVEAEYGVLATSCVYGNVFRISENKKVSLRDYSRVKCPVKSDVVIVSRMNTPQLVGACGYSGVSYNNIFLPDRLWQISFDKHVLPQYAWRYLSSRKVQMWFAAIATGSSSTMKNITKPQLKAVLMPCPEIDTQKKVIDSINEFSYSCQKAIDSLSEQISALHELRTCLISDVVTGQIDVRNIAIPDFELVDEIDADEESPDEEVEPSEVNEQ